MGIFSLKSELISNINFEINVLDIFGNILFKSQNSNNIDISQFENGIYYLSIRLDSNEIIYKKIILMK